jgi:hypothetical protein
MAQLVGASVQRWTAIGLQVGVRVWRRGDEPEQPAGPARGPRQEHLDGFDLHADVWVPPMIAPGSAGVPGSAALGLGRRTGSGSGRMGGLW